MVTTLRADEEVLALDFPLEAHSILSAIDSCETFLSSHGVHSDSHAYLVFMGLLKRAIWTDEMRNDGGSASICIEHLSGETFRITIQSKNRRDECKHVEMHVTHTTSDESEPPEALVKTMKSQLVADTKGRASRWTRGLESGKGQRRGERS